MRTYVARGLAMALAVGAAALLLLAAAPAKPAEETSGAAPDAVRPAAETALLRIRSETQREAVSVYTDVWEEIARLRLDGAGEGTLPRPPAGFYRLIRGNGSTMRFALDADGQVQVKSGKGYGRGDTLFLTAERRGSVALCCDTPGAQGTVCRLEGDGTVYSAALLRGTGEGASCCFTGLRAGAYQLYVGGDWVISVELTEQAMERRIELY